MNTIGGGSWASEFEVITGMDTRFFGVSGRFTHASLSRYSKRTFPRYLRERGYSVSAFMNSEGSFYNYQNGYANYGFNQFFDEKFFDHTSEDRRIMQTALNLLPREPDAPFLKYVLLAEGHSPHWCSGDPSVVYPSVRLTGTPSDDQACAVKEYLRRVGNTAEAISIVQEFLEGEKAATGRDYVIAVYGDHQPYSLTGGGSVDHNMGLNFDEFRRDLSKRRTIFKIISSKPNPLKCCGNEPIPLTLLPTLISSYVAKSARELYLPESAYQLDRCGSDWIGRLIGSSFYGRDAEVKISRCDAFDEIVAAFQDRGVMGYPDGDQPWNSEQLPRASLKNQTEMANACFDPTGRVSMSVFASGTANGPAPRFQVLFDDYVVMKGSVDWALSNILREREKNEIKSEAKFFSFDTVITSVPRYITIVFSNDSWAGPDQTGDTDLWFKEIQIENQVFSSAEFGFKPSDTMRGSYDGDWFRFATNGHITLDLQDGLCGKKSTLIEN